MDDIKTKPEVGSQKPIDKIKTIVQVMKEASMNGNVAHISMLKVQATQLATAHSEELSKTLRAGDDDVCKAIMATTQIANKAVDEMKNSGEKMVEVLVKFAKTPEGQSRNTAAWREKFSEVLATAKAEASEIYDTMENEVIPVIDPLPENKADMLVDIFNGMVGIVSELNARIVNAIGGALSKIFDFLKNPERKLIGIANAIYVLAMIAWEDINGVRKLAWGGPGPVVKGGNTSALFANFKGRTRLAPEGVSGWYANNDDESDWKRKLEEARERARKQAEIDYEAEKKLRDMQDWDARQKLLDWMHRMLGGAW